MPASGGTPLTRLHDTATQLGIIVVDAIDADGPLLDDDTAAFIACGVCIALNPGLDDGLRGDVLAMALALTYALSHGTADHGGDITAASGFVLISRTRETAPVSALGVLATVIAHEHGHDTASAAFEYTLADIGLAQHAARNARRPQLAGAPRHGAQSSGGDTGGGIAVQIRGDLPAGRPRPAGCLAAWPRRRGCRVGGADGADLQVVRQRLGHSSLRTERCALANIRSRANQD